MNVDIGDKYWGTKDKPTVTSSSDLQRFAYLISRRLESWIIFVKTSINPRIFTPFMDDSTAEVIPILFWTASIHFTCLLFDEPLTQAVLARIQ